MYIVTHSIFVIAEGAGLTSHHDNEEGQNGELEKEDSYKEDEDEQSQL